MVLVPEPDVDDRRPRLHLLEARSLEEALHTGIGSEREEEQDERRRDDVEPPYVLTEDRVSDAHVHGEAERGGADEVIGRGGAIEDPDDRVLGGDHQTAVHPPSTASTWPVT